MPVFAPYTRPAALAMALILVACSGAGGTAASGLPPTAAAATSTSVAPPALISREVNPRDTDAAIDTVSNLHYVVVDPRVPPRGRLVLFLTGAVAGGLGTGSSTGLITETAAAMGFHAINLGYPNREVLLAVCGNGGKDASCWERAHLSALYGGVANSPLTTGTVANSIVSRLVHLLQYLATTYPREGWATFLDGAEPKWSLIVGAGLSLGGGHIAMLARDHELARVALLESPVDRLQQKPPAIPAPWVTTPHKTPADRYYAFAHVMSPVTIAFYESSWRAMGISAFGPTLNVDSAPLASAKTHQFSTAATPAIAGEFHASVATDNTTPIGADGLPVFAGVWRLLLGGTLGFQLASRSQPCSSRTSGTVTTCAR